MSRKLCMGCMQEYDARNGICPNCGADNRGIPRDASELKPGIYLNQGRYFIGLSLGSSKYNITYIGCDIKTGEKIVIKEYFPREYCSRQTESGLVKIMSKQNSEAFQQGMQEFSRDGQQMLSLRNPGMVRMRDVFTENGTVYQVMDYLEGNTLREILDGHTFSMEETLSIMLPVIETLCSLHKQGILHLNVHPNNVFLLKTGEVRLMDIGRWNCNLAKSGIEAEVSDYQAPELRIRDIQMEAGADIYSICAIMYQMLTGNTPLSSIERIHGDHMLSPKQQGAKINNSQDNIIMNGLEPEYLRRTSQMDIFLDQLTSVRMVERILPEVEKAVSKPDRQRRSTYSQESESASAKKSGGKNILFFALPCLLIVIAAVGIFTIKSKKSASNNGVIIDQKDTKTAPNIIGANVKEVKKELEGKIELNITDAEKVKDGENPDTIVSQEPAAGEALNQENKSINVTVLSEEISIKKALEAVDNYKHNIYGHKYSENLETMLRESFNIYSAEEQSYIIPGYLVRIAKGRPDTNTELTEDGKILKYKPITLIKSKGQSETEKGVETGRKAENIIGENPEDIGKWAENNKFYYGISDEEEYSVHPTTKGEVASVKVNGKSVKEDTEIKKWDEVELVLSKGPKRVNLKKNYWLGKTSTEVENYLEGKKLKAEFTYAYSDTVPKEQIIGENAVDSPYDENQIDEEQKKKDGSRYKYYEGDTVKLTVSLGEKPQPVTTEARPSTGGSGSGGSSRKSSSGSRKKTKTSKPGNNGTKKEKTTPPNASGGGGSFN